jgi:hypothetical protein
MIADLRAQLFVVWLKNVHFVCQVAKVPGFGGNGVFPSPVTFLALGGIACEIQFSWEVRNERLRVKSAYE